MKDLVTTAMVNVGAAILVHEQSRGLCTLDAICDNCDCGLDTGKNLRDTYARLHTRDILEAVSVMIANEVLAIAKADIKQCHQKQTQHAPDNFSKGVESALWCLEGLQAELALEEGE